jgi:hypothetical protein
MTAIEFDIFTIPAQDDKITLVCQVGDTFEELVTIEKDKWLQ